MAEMTVAPGLATTRRCPSAAAPSGHSWVARCSSSLTGNAGCMLLAPPNPRVRDSVAQLTGTCQYVPALRSDPARAVPNAPS